MHPHPTPFRSSVIFFEPLSSAFVCTFLVFLNYTSGYLKFCKTFCLIEMAWSRAFQTCIIYHFLDNFFLQTFLLYNWILQKNSIFANSQFFLQILKVEHKSFPMMYYLSYLDIKHGIKRGGGSNSPPP